MERYWGEEIPTVTEEAEMLLQNVVETERNLSAGMRDEFASAVYSAITSDMEAMTERLRNDKAARASLASINDARRHFDGMRLHLDIVEGYAESLGRHIREQEPWTLRSVELLKPIVRGIAALHGISESL